MDIQETDCMELAIESLNSIVRHKQDLLVNGHLLPEVADKLRKEIFSLITAIKLIEEKWNVE